jgi:hypothetical protein
MLLTRDEMTLDWGGEKLSPVHDRVLLEWLLNQFLYGEITGIQVGQWLYDAPSVNAARFLAKQAIEELQHVGNFVRMQQLLGVKAGPAHPMVRFLATGMMADSWAEHVALEMATGEGFVLMAFYGVIDTLDHPESVAILERAVKQEESHVEFGEQETMRLVAGDPALARRLLGLSLVWRFGVEQLARFMQTRLPPHPVLAKLPAFLKLALSCNELRLQRMGLLVGSLDQMSPVKRAALVAEAYAWKGGSTAARIAKAPLALIPFAGGKKRLTDTYLDDPEIAKPADPLPSKRSSRTRVSSRAN